MSKERYISALEELKGDSTGIIAATIEDCKRVIRELPEEHIPHEKRCKTYTNALVAYGDRAQMTVAIEEMAECQQAICKILRGGENFDHLAEEVADATIMLEQVQMMFNINERVSCYMDQKVQRLDKRLREV